MPFALAFIGILLLVAAVRGTEKDLLAQMSDDARHFVVWLVLLLTVGLLGMSEKWKPVSNAFLVLISIAFVLRNANQILTGYRQLTQG